jgi:short-subunit dehydrogenase
MAPYNVTKAAVVALSETLRAELDGTGVHVTVLCPTFFRTGILDASRGSDPSQRAMVEKRMDGSKIQAPQVARAALDAAEAGTLYAVPMWDGWVSWRLKRLAPELFPRLAARAERFLR